ncbi:MAG: histidinol-phosphate transaminase [Acidimicrobiia bacterium]
MLKFRSDLESVTPYSPGKPIEEVARELGLSEIAKLASNESPLPPFPEVQQVLAAGIEGSNRYPDNSCYHLTQVLADHLGISPERLLVGAGSTDLLRCTGEALGGTGTSAVYATPSFVMYAIITRLAGAEAVEVPLDSHMRHDLDGMAKAIRADTTVVYVCNPNNPTGTYVASAALRSFIDEVPETVLVVVDEAYHHYATAADYATMLPEALGRHNVVVAHTFSKVYGLAGLRVGFLVGDPDALGYIRRAQMPFSVNSLAQAAAVECLRHPDRVEQRVKQNAKARQFLGEELQRRNIPFVESQTNFLLVDLGESARYSEDLMKRGVIVRPMGEYLRVTIGTEVENHKLLAGLDALLPGAAP